MWTELSEWAKSMKVFVSPMQARSVSFLSLTKYLRKQLTGEGSILAHGLRGLS
jgi:hypothetical protein